MCGRGMCNAPPPFLRKASRWLPPPTHAQQPCQPCSQHQQRRQIGNGSELPVQDIVIGMCASHIGVYDRSGRRGSHRNYTAYNQPERLCAPRPRAPRRSDSALSEVKVQFGYAAAAVSEFQTYRLGRAVARSQVLPSTSLAGGRASSHSLFRAIRVQNRAVFHLADRAV
ncbi:MAG: hypothetical protein KatS3mg019_2582 [Fimbriimonadales bacterium]|nr:MAG: hypothetical protein KatS3mg019_2582 [Fimbriimonadales bacterium]